MCRAPIPVTSCQVTLAMNTPQATRYTPSTQRQRPETRPSGKSVSGRGSNMISQIHVAARNAPTRGYGSPP